MSRTCYEASCGRTMPTANQFSYSYSSGGKTIMIGSTRYEMAENLDTHELLPIIILNREQAAELADGICDWLQLEIRLENNE